MHAKKLIIVILVAANSFSLNLHANFTINNSAYENINFCKTPKVLQLYLICPFLIVLSRYLAIISAGSLEANGEGIREHINEVLVWLLNRKIIGGGDREVDDPGAAAEGTSYS